MGILERTCLEKKADDLDDEFELAMLWMSLLALDLARHRTFNKEILDDEQQHYSHKEQTIYRLLLSNSHNLKPKIRFVDVLKVLYVKNINV